MLSLQLAQVTLHKYFTISAKQKIYIIDDTKYNI